jgi:hypothetical protein
LPPDLLRDGAMNIRIDFREIFQRSLLRSSHTASWREKIIAKNSISFESKRSRTILKSSLKSKRKVCKQKCCHNSGSK